jgi:hypothetical protein
MGTSRKSSYGAGKERKKHKPEEKFDMMRRTDIKRL